MLKFGIVGDGNDGIAPFTGCPVPVPTSKPDQYTPVTLLLFQHRPRSSSVREASDRQMQLLSTSLFSPFALLLALFPPFDPPPLSPTLPFSLTVYVSFVLSVSFSFRWM